MCVTDGVSVFIFDSSLLVFWCNFFLFCFCILSVCVCVYFCCCCSVSIFRCWCSHPLSPVYPQTPTLAGTLTMIHSYATYLQQQQLQQVFQPKCQKHLKQRRLSVLRNMIRTNSVFFLLFLGGCFDLLLISKYFQGLCPLEQASIFRHL